jgi:hypothetical protein
MDSGWALVIGAGIALFGSAIVPWVKETIQAERREEAERRAALASAIAAVADHLSAVGKRVVRSKGWANERIDAIAALLKLGLLLKPDEVAIERMSDAALTAVSQGKGRSVGLYLQLVGQWYRGEIKPDEAFGLYELGMEQADAKRADTPVTTPPAD